MSAILQKVIEQFDDPYLGCTWKEAPVSYEISDQHNPVVRVNLPYPLSKDRKIEWERTLQNQLTARGAHGQFKLEIVCHIKGNKPLNGLKRLPGISNIITIASGKGGVGKSTTAVHIAISLSQQGAKVGLLDADIYGPNIPRMLGAQGQTPEVKENRWQPIICHGIHTMSIGYLLNKQKTPMVWRGPMVSGALLQLLNQTDWPSLDYLIIDLPPGTGDTQLTLSQKIPVSGAVIVTTPEVASYDDAAKALLMFEKVKIPILGIVENMSDYTCHHCGTSQTLFKGDAGQMLAKHHGYPLLGQLPLVPEIGHQLSLGDPLSLSSPRHPIAQTFQELVCKMTAKLYIHQQKAPTIFPKIVVEAT